MNAISSLKQEYRLENQNNSTIQNIKNTDSSNLSNQSTQKNEKQKPELEKIVSFFSNTLKQELSIKEKLDLMILQNEERSVREHERAHLRAARDLAISGPTYEYQRGPDGKKYAIHGEVQIDYSGVSGDAEATIEKALKIQYAALAPADPSPKDLQAAARAKIMESKAYRKINRENQNQDNTINNPIIDAYQNVQTNQKNLYEILELFA